jgi:glutamate synthase (NADPH/NADH) large chain
MVISEKPGKDDITQIKSMIEKHYKYTGSLRAKEILDDFENKVQKFVKVISPRYKELLAEGKVK